MQDQTKIVKFEASSDDVKITLANGTTVLIASNKGYVHVHFSGIDGKLLVNQFAANNIDIMYTPGHS